MDAEFIQNASRQFNELWVKPELDKRASAGMLPENFVILQCLVRLPRNREPIVEFNDEIAWAAQAEPVPTKGFEKGEAVHLHDLKRIVTVYPPEVDGKAVAFVFIFRTEEGYRVIFDFSPNSPSSGLSDEEREWKFGNLIANYVQMQFEERTVRAFEGVKDKVGGIGLWLAPALLPYPMNSIMHELECENIQAARDVLVSTCTSEWIGELAADWWSCEQMELRRPLVEEALISHQNRLYNASIHMLLPQTEGIITDWEYCQVAKETVPYRPESRAKRFRDIALKYMPSSYTNLRVTESMSEFVISGPVLSTFTNWLDNIETNFPNRHAVSHGRYVTEMYTEENSVKVFLLIDTIVRVISRCEEMEKRLSASMAFEDGCSGGS